MDKQRISQSRLWVDSILKKSRFVDFILAAFGAKSATFRTINVTFFKKDFSPLCITRRSHHIDIRGYCCVGMSLLLSLWIIQDMSQAKGTICCCTSNYLFCHFTQCSKYILFCSQIVHSHLENNIVLVQPRIILDRYRTYRMQYVHTISILNIRGRKRQELVLQDLFP